MGYLVRMALRNLLRNKRRSALAMISVALAVLLCVFLQGFTGGFISSIVRNYTKNETGHIRITSRDYLARSDMMPVDALVANPAAIERTIEASPALAGQISLVTERIRFGVLLENAGHNASAVAIAGDPKREESLLYLQRSIKDGRYIAGPGETIMGAGLASDLKLSVGESLKVVSEASDGSLQLKKLKIVGIFRTGVSALDDATFQIPIEDAKRFLRTGGGTQSIIVMLNNYRRAQAVAAKIESLLADPNLAVTPWTAIGDYPKLVELEERLINYIVLVVLFLGAFIITNIMMMIVLERRREIGILKSMGLSNGQVLVLFLWEGIFLGLWGSLVGAAGGLALNILFHARGMDFSAAMSSLDYPVDNVIHTVVDVPLTLAVVALGAAVAGVVSLLPSRRAARMNVVDSIKSV